MAKKKKTPPKRKTLPKRKTATAPVGAKPQSKARPDLAGQPYSTEEGASQSMLYDWIDCRMRSKLNLLGYRRTASTAALDYGSLWHAVLEHVGIGAQAGQVRTPADTIAIKDKIVLRERKRMSATNADHTEMVIAKLEALWPVYAEVYAKDWSTDLWVELEGLFDIPWHGLRLRGKRDGIRKQKPRGLRLFETKTKSQVDQNEIMEALGFDFQSLFYITAVDAELSARGMAGQMKGVLYNVIKNPSHKLGTKDSPTLAAYVKTVRKACEKQPEKYFCRFEASYTRTAIEEFQTELYNIVKDFTQWHADGMPVRYRNRACRDRKFRCPFRGYCSTGSLDDLERSGRLFVELEED